ncbi:hypothetical protein MMC07_003118 [Pseudocyphellaria aurata]|nr:hypothetical protein [Pseudocyphellaria aurata]
MLDSVQKPRGEDSPGPPHAGPRRETSLRRLSRSISCWTPSRNLAEKTLPVHLPRRETSRGPCRDVSIDRPRKDYGTLQTSVEPFPDYLDAIFRYWRDVSIDRPRKDYGTLQTSVEPFPDYLDAIFKYWRDVSIERPREDYGTLWEYVAEKILPVQLILDPVEKPRRVFGGNTPRIDRPREDYGTLWEYVAEKILPVQLTLDPVEKPRRVFGGNTPRLSRFQIISMRSSNTGGTSASTAPERTTAPSGSLLPRRSYPSSTGGETSEGLWRKHTSVEPFPDYLDAIFKYWRDVSIDRPREDYGILWDPAYAGPGGETSEGLWRKHTSVEPFPGYLDAIFEYWRDVSIDRPREDYGTLWEYVAEKVLPVQLMLDPVDIPRRVRAAADEGLPWGGRQKEATPPSSESGHHHRALRTSLNLPNAIFQYWRDVSIERPRIDYGALWEYVAEKTLPLQLMLDPVQKPRGEDSPGPSHAGPCRETSRGPCRDVSIDRPRKDYGTLQTSVESFPDYLDAIFQYWRNYVAEKSLPIQLMLDPVEKPRVVHAAPRADEGLPWGSAKKRLRLPAYWRNVSIERPRIDFGALWEYVAEKSLPIQLMLDPVEKPRVVHAAPRADEGLLWGSAKKRLRRPAVSQVIITEH